jgi:toxin ParE1/3/4
VKAAVVVTQDALHDLDDLHAYVSSHDGLARADQVLDGIQTVLSKLSSFPNRGEYPPELAGLGIREFRQVHHKPYRMIYQLRDKTVYVLLVMDGRRDMKAMLQRRLLG